VELQWVESLTTRVLCESQTRITGRWVYIWLYCPAQVLSHSPALPSAIY